VELEAANLTTPLLGYSGLLLWCSGWLLGVFLGYSGCLIYMLLYRC